MKDELIIIIGRTASGKDTLAEQLAVNGRVITLTHTTRDRRPNEGDTHIFIDNLDDYPERWVETTINGNTYFLLEKNVYEDDILLIDPIGFYSLANDRKPDRPYRVIYIDIDKEIRKERYMKRANTSEDVFLERDSAEDEQFTEFEGLLESRVYRNFYNIEVVRNNEEINDLALRLGGVTLEEVR